MAKTPKELPCVLYRVLDDPPESQYCRVKTQEEYDKAKADGWQDEPPKDWNNLPDPANPGGTLPQKEIDITAVPAEESEKVATAKAGEKTPTPPSVLDGSVVELTAAIANQTDVRTLQNLRLEETKGKNRTGALAAIDARIAELKE